MTWDQILFYIVFASQILLLSIVLPRRILARMQHVRETYPPADYPKLYPDPAEKYAVSRFVFQLAYLAVAGLGFVIMLLMIFVVDHGTFAADGFISEAWPAGYGMVQFLPFMLLEVSEFRQFRLMRQLNTRTTRKAELRPRRLVDFVSPGLLAAAATFFVGCVVFDLYAHDWVISWGHDTVQRTLTMAGTNLLLVAAGAWNLHGRKLNPHQTHADRSRQTRIVLRSLCYISMALSVFLVTQAADDIYRLAHLNAVLISLYFQVIGMLSIGFTVKCFETTDVDFDVYKAEVAGA